MGVLFLDAPVSNRTSTGQDGLSLDFYLPSIPKKQSKSSEGFGNSYSFRINVRSNSIADDTSLEINDDSTTSQVVVEDFTGVFSKLNTCIKILMNQGRTIEYINDKYEEVKYNQLVEFNKIQNLDNRINTYLSIDGSYFGGIDKAKFRKKVVPGDKIRLECEIIKQKGPVGIGKATATVDGKVAVSAEMTFMVG